MPNVIGDVFNPALVAQAVQQNNQIDDRNLRAAIADRQLKEASKERYLRNMMAKRAEENRLEQIRLRMGADGETMDGGMTAYQRAGLDLKDKQFQQGIALREREAERKETRDEQLQLEGRARIDKIYDGMTQTELMNRARMGDLAAQERLNNARAATEEALKDIKVDQGKSDIKLTDAKTDKTKADTGWARFKTKAGEQRLPHEVFKMEWDGKRVKQAVTEAVASWDDRLAMLKKNVQLADSKIAKDKAQREFMSAQTKRLGMLAGAQIDEMASRAAARAADTDHKKAMLAFRKDMHAWQKDVQMADTEKDWQNARIRLMQIKSEVDRYGRPLREYDPDLMDQVTQMETAFDAVLKVSIGDAAFQRIQKQLGEAQRKVGNANQQHFGAQFLGAIRGWAEDEE